MTKIRLSHSSKETYLQCPKKWELYYREKLRSTKIGSALFFGSAFDDALNSMLLAKKHELTEEDEELCKYSPEETFKRKFTTVSILKDDVDISKSDAAMYYKSDLDVTLLEAIDHDSAVDFAQELELDIKNSFDLNNFIEEAQLEMKRGLDETTQKMYNYICWLSLYRKGLMLLEAYRVQVLPEIEEVFDVQKRISLPDGDDEFIGYIDMVCSFTSEPGVKYICDNKTSSRPYQQDSVTTSEQLAAYAEHEETNKAAYLVVEKKLRKREPRVRTQIIKGTISEDTFNITFDKVTNVLSKVKEGKFEKNMEDNNCFQYGRKCEYYQHCRTGDLKGLKYPNKENDNGK